MKRCIATIGVVLLATVTAAGQVNLLANADLEGQDGFILPPGSCSAGTNWYYRYNCIPEIEPPTWWRPFWNAGPTPVGDLNFAVSGDAQWMSCSPTSGSVSGDAVPITVSYDVTGLSAGSYEGEITVTSPEASNSPQTLAVHLLIETVKPDQDGDGDVDLNDFGLFQRCLSGAAQPQLDPNCQRALLDGDEDVDESDFQVLTACLGGADVPAPRTCDE